MASREWAVERTWDLALFLQNAARFLSSCFAFSCCFSPFPWLIFSFLHAHVALWLSQQEEFQFVFQQEGPFCVAAEILWSGVAAWSLPRFCGAEFLSSPMLCCGAVVAWCQTTVAGRILDGALAGWLGAHRQLRKGSHRLSS